ncbi:MAG TPA: ATP phosphoribosyltransferase regulatory subunit [Candidatus Choladousia intestinigallinarum]|nr:ATP phosphoribosyltransferase regulatory subunit [Candidatus Choladousia intestinigallinarum]
MRKILHTPEGVRDIYNQECEQKLALQERMHRAIKSYGYRDIETPTFEFFDVFSKEVGTIPSRDLYKFFDREGNTLVLRPDFTPPIARAAAKYYLNDSMTVRLTYLGNAFVNNSSLQGRLKETTQIGAELIGDDSADADAEVVALVIRTLLESGLKEFQISLGHAGFFQSLADEAGFDEDMVGELRRLISNKNTFGVERFLEQWGADETLKKMFSSLSGLFGGREVLDQARELAAGKKALASLDRLEEIWEILKLYQVEKYVSFDLGMLNRYRYYTGIIFRGYTLGTGDAVVKGGRYDHLLGHFGKDAPSVGFVAVIDQLLVAMNRQKITQPVSVKHCMILYEKEKRGEAIRRATELRSEGIETELVHITEKRTREECRKYAEESQCVLVVEL